MLDLSVTVHDIEERRNLLRIKKRNLHFGNTMALSVSYMWKKAYSLHVFCVTFPKSENAIQICSDHGGAMIVLSRKFLFFDTFSIEKTWHIPPLPWIIFL